VEGGGRADRAPKFVWVQLVLCSRWPFLFS
jgi:hypothetical protein